MLARLLPLVLLAGAVCASVFTSQQIYTADAPLDGRYIVLTSDAERAGGARRYSVAAVAAPDRMAAQQMFPDAVIAPNRRVTAARVTSQWNLDRLDNRQQYQLDGQWVGPANGGAGVRIYVVDTGVQGAHTDFTGRVTNAWTAFGSDFSDSCGHGTHVAAIAGGNNFGVARGAEIHSVKVLGGPGCDGTTETVAGGLAHVLSSAAGRRVVINLSLGFYGYDAVIDSLVQAARSAGHIVVAAAGNDASDACAHYPSGFAGVVAVAASDRRDAAAGFSNYGSCVDCYAPGVAVRSADAQAPNGGSLELSGTSMASPHVAGVAALIWQAAPGLSNAAVINTLLQTATAGVVTGRSGSPDLLLYWSDQPEEFTTGSPSPPPPPPSSSSSAFVVQHVLWLACMLCVAMN